MQHEIGLEQQTANTPHFDDERTLRSAKQVVPLSEIRGHALTRRRVFMGGALLLAVALGASSALVIVHLRRPATVQTSAAEEQSPNQSEEQSDSSVASVKNTGASDSSAPKQTPLSSTEGVREGEQSQAAQPDDAQKTERKHAKHIRVKPEQVGPNRVQDGDDAHQPILVDQWQEKRARRVTRIDPRKGGNHHRSDLFRIRDIFEGERPRE